MLPQGTMKAYTFSSTAGGLEANLKSNLKAPLPATASALKPDQTLVRVLYTSLNPIDYKLPEIPLIGRLVIDTPSSPGLDYAGRVVASGPNTKRVSGDELKEGQLVFGRLDGPTKFGTLAEYTVVPRAGCVPVPDGVTAEDAAAVGTAALSAYQSLFPYVKAGGRVFINGGSGGTGIYGIQLAKAMSCYVATTCSTANIDLCKRLGADEVIDYKKSDIIDSLRKLRKFDHVVDNVGDPEDLYRRAHEFTNKDATYIQVGVHMSLAGVYGFLGRMLWPRILGGGQRPYKMLGCQSNYEEFTKIGQWMKEGKVKSVLDEVFKMEGDGPQHAFQKLKTGRAKGKILIQVPEQ